MPLFEFRCGTCEHEHEFLVRGDNLPQCPVCGSEDQQKLFSAPAAPVVKGRLPVASTCPPADAPPCGPGCCRLP